MRSILQKFRILNFDGNKIAQALRSSQPHGHPAIVGFAARAMIPNGRFDTCQASSTKRIHARYQAGKDQCEIDPPDLVFFVVAVANELVARAWLAAK
jgi:hypothetical protein